MRGAWRECAGESVSPAAARLHMQPTDDCFSICLLLHRVAESAAFTISVSGQVAATSSAPPAFLLAAAAAASGGYKGQGGLDGGLELQDGALGDFGEAAGRRL